MFVSLTYLPQEAELALRDWRYFHLTEQSTQLFIFIHYYAHTHLLFSFSMIKCREYTFGMVKTKTIYMDRLRFLIIIIITIINDETAELFSPACIQNSSSLPVKRSRKRKPVSIMTVRGRWSYLSSVCVSEDVCCGKNNQITALYWKRDGQTLRPTLRFSPYFSVMET